MINLVKNRSFSGSTAKQITFTAIFAALCCIGTVVITIPLPIGFFNTGDIFVLLSGWFMGPFYGFIAAGVGSALADVLAGFPIYAPATFIIKAAMAVVGYFAATLFNKTVKKAPDFVGRAVSAVLAEILMILGYFAYEAILYGAPVAVLTLVGNGMQGVFGIIGATLLCALLAPVPAIKGFFPALAGTLNKSADGGEVASDGDNG